MQQGQTVTGSSGQKRRSVGTHQILQVVRHTKRPQQYFLIGTFEVVGAPILLNGASSAIFPAGSISEIKLLDALSPNYRVTVIVSQWDAATRQVNILVRKNTNSTAYAFATIEKGRHYISNQTGAITVHDTLDLDDTPVTFIVEVVGNVMTSKVSTAVTATDTIVYNLVELGPKVEINSQGNYIDSWRVEPL